MLPGFLLYATFFPFFTLVFPSERIWNGEAARNETESEPGNMGSWEELKGEEREFCYPLTTTRGCGREELVCRFCRPNVHYLSHQWLLWSVHAGEKERASWNSTEKVQNEYDESSLRFPRKVMLYGLGERKVLLAGAWCCHPDDPNHAAVQCLAVRDGVPVSWWEASWLRLLLGKVLSTEQEALPGRFVCLSLTV